MGWRRTFGTNLIQSGSIEDANQQYQTKTNPSICYSGPLDQMLVHQNRLILEGWCREFDFFIVHRLHQGCTKHKSGYKEKFTYWIKSIKSIDYWRPEQESKHLLEVFKYGYVNECLPLYTSICTVIVPVNKHILCISWYHLVGLFIGVALPYTGDRTLRSPFTWTQSCSSWESGWPN